MSWKESFLSSKRKKLVQSLKNGGFFKTTNDGYPYLMGYCDHLVEDEYEDDWHGLHCVFFFNFMSQKFHVNDTCGCSQKVILSRPSVKDVSFIKELLKSKGYNFNRKKKTLWRNKSLEEGRYITSATKIL